MKLAKPVRAVYCQCPDIPDVVPDIGVCRKVLGAYVCL